MISIDPDNLTPAGREFYLRHRESQEKLRLAAIKPVHTRQDSITTPTPLPVSDGQATCPTAGAKTIVEPPIESNLIFDVKTPMMKVAETLGRQIVDDLTSRKSEPVARPALDWDELGKQAKISDHIPDTREMVCGVRNLLYDENYIPPDDGLGF